MHTIDFYFDYISPYAYLAWNLLRRESSEWGWELKSHPILFAGLLNAHGQLGPAEIPAKRAYIFKDMVRSSQRLKIPLNPPHSHPFNPLGLLRATLCLEGEARNRLVDHIFSGLWSKGMDPQAVDWALESLPSDEAGRIRLRMQDSSIKDALRLATKSAIEKGIFGVPTYILDREFFWGLDSIDNLKAYLRGEWQMDGDLERVFLAVKPSAVRPGSDGKSRI